MAEPLLIDTDVLIDYLRGQVDAVTYLEDLSAPILMSMVTLAELYTGVREGEERQALDTFITVFELVPIDQEIARRGGLLRRDYYKSHKIGLADALIAATAEVRQATLVTLNQRHFPMLSRVITPYRKV
jgi:predicted nucleic acid-binding protein